MEKFLLKLKDISFKISKGVCGLFHSLRFIKLNSKVDLKTLFLPILVILLAFPAVMFLDAEAGYENGLIENIQMVVLTLGIFFTLFTNDKENKKLYIFIFLFITVMILREINCGRTIFFAKENCRFDFYSWKEIKYGFLVNPVFGVYICAIAFYFLKNKIYIQILDLIKKFQLPAYNIFIMLFGMFIASYSEKILHKPILEEMGELAAYVSFVTVIFMYSFKKCLVKNQKEDAEKTP